MTKHEKGLGQPATPETPAKAARLRRDQTAPVNAEIPFPIDDIFFSRTNEKGHILFGNTVFQRISMYSWDELHRKPHSIIRHPDMPRAVFWLLWDTIEKGEPVGAYVKNMAKDGRYYWVFAIVTPIEGGYLSVRIKPTGPFLPLIAQEYAALAAVEKAHRLKPAESAIKLLARLAELGFLRFSLCPIVLFYRRGVELPPLRDVCLNESVNRFGLQKSLAENLYDDGFDGIEVIGAFVGATRIFSMS